MREVKNKERSESETMNKTLQNIMDAAAAIHGEAPQLRAQYVRGLIDAQEAQKTAQALKDKAQTEGDFEAACDQADRAHEKEGFYRRKIELIDFTPRMDLADYDELVRSASDVVSGSAEKFRTVAVQALAALAAARAECEKNAADADKVLSALDDAANVLQVRHRYKIYKYQGAPDELVEDRSEWTRHAVRFADGTAYRMATANDRAIAAAWQAAGVAIQK